VAINRLWQCHAARRTAASESAQSAVRFAAVSHAGNLDGAVAAEIQKHAVVAAAQPEARARRLQFLHVAGAARQIAAEAVQNLQRNLPLRSPQIGASFRRPDDGDRSGAASRLTG